MTAAWRTIAEMQTRDLVRRRGALLLLAGLPLSWYIAEAASGVPYAVGTGILAIAWSTATAPLFAVLGARGIDQRLVRTGYRPGDIVCGRLVSLLGTSSLLALAFGVVMVIGSRPARAGDVFLALLLTALVSTPIGWLTASVVPRELEGTLLLIGLVGLQISIPTGAPDWLVPYYAPLRLTDYERDPGSVGFAVAHAVLWSVVLGVMAVLLWRRRIVVRQTGRI